MFAAGILFGVLFALPVFGTSLPDGTATLLGSALGAAIAVSGAAWVAGSKERAEGNAKRAAVLEITRRLDDWVIDTCNEISAACQQPAGPNISHKHAANAARQRVHDAQAAVERLRPSFESNALHLQQLMVVDSVLNDLGLALARATSQVMKVLTTAGRDGFDEEIDILQGRTAECRTLVSQLDYARKRIGASAPPR